jgi:predicted GIY-YIG superfamily endonuclease/restriction endonuclease S subunit
MRSTAQRFHTRDVIYARLRPYLNKVWRADREGLCSSEFIVLPENDRIDADFLRYRLNAQDFVSFATHLNTGDRPRVDFDQISAFQTWLPNSMDKQREIVAEIEKQFTRLETGVAGLRRVQANLKRYRAAVLKAACEGKLVPTEAELARQEGRALPAPRPGVFFVYALRCDNDSIYIGQTQDLQKRWEEHLAGQAADWTSKHKPVLIVHYEEYSSREEAVAREKWLKTGFGRKWIRREIAAGRARQAGYETGTQLLERILTERREKWNGKGKYKEPAKPGTANLPSLPEGWSYTGIAALLSRQRAGMKTGPFGSLLKKGDHRSSGIPVLGIENIESMKFVPGSKIHITREKALHLASYRVERGDVIISRSGTVGEVCVVPAELGEAIISTNLLRVSFQANAMSPRFFCLLFNGSPFVLGQVQELCKGSTRNFLNQHILNSVIFPLPPVPEQDRIVAEVDRCLSVVEELDAVVHANLQRTSRLRQSILQQAFEGQLLLQSAVNAFQPHRTCL